MISLTNIVFAHTSDKPADIDAVFSMPLLNVTRMTDLAPQYQAVSDDSSIPMVLIAGIALVLAAIAGGVFWYYRTREPEVPTSDAVTMDLCRAHGLSIYHRGLIDRLAAAAELSHTAEMFLSPSHFDSAVEKPNKPSGYVGITTDGWAKFVERSSTREKQRRGQFVRPQKWPIK